MKLYLIVLLCLCFGLSVSGQTFNGSVFDETSMNSLQGATVVLKGISSDTIVSDQNGNFSFTDLQKGKYILKVSHIGYEDFQARLEMEASAINLKIALKIKSWQLNEIQVISASRRQSPSVSLPYALSSAGSPSGSVNMPRSTPEALNNIPGIFVQKTNHGGGSPFIRGLTGNQTLILIDGIRLNNSTFRYGPNQYLNTIDPFTIEKIEILRGSGSVQYGSDAIGGVIQVFTKEPVFTNQSQLKGKLTAKYWNYNMERSGSGEINISGPRLSFSGILSAKDFGDLFGGDTTGRQSPSGYTETDAYLKARWKISEASEIILANQYVKQNNVDIFHKVKLENYSLNEMSVQDRNLAYVKFITKGHNPFFQQLNINASFNRTFEERNNRKAASIITSNERDKINTRNVSIELFSALNNNWTANSGTEFYYDRIKSTRKTMNDQDGAEVIQRGLYPLSSYLNASVFSLHHFTFLKFNVETGARYNWLRSEVYDTDLGEIKVSPGAFVFNAGITYNLNNNHWYASLNSGYRAPNIDDMGTLGIVDFRYEIPSYSLKAEKNYNTEIGYKYSAVNWNAGTAFYYNKLNNLITRIQTGAEIDGYKVYQKENTGEAIIKGVEAYMEWQANQRLFLEASASFNHGQNVSDSEPLRRIPPLNGNLSVNYKLTALYLKAEIMWADDQSRLAKGDLQDNRIPSGGTPGWKILNLYSGYTIIPVQIKLSAQNIFNQDYRTHGSGINSVGRSFWMSLQYDF